MSEENIQDFIGILNVTINGLESMGRLGLQLTKGTIGAASRMISVARWVGATLSTDTKTSGKVRTSSMVRRFSDLRFTEMPLYSPAVIHRQLNEQYPGNYNLEKIEQFLNPDVLQKEFEKVAKKCGLVYARVPNFIPDQHTGVAEFRFAYSMSQTQAKNEAISQMQAYIAKQLRKCGADKHTAQQVSERATGQTDTSFTESLAHLGVERITEDQFDIIMESTYPDYYPEKIEAVEPPEETKLYYRQMIETKEKPVPSQKRTPGTPTQIEARRPAMLPGKTVQPKK